MSVYDVYRGWVSKAEADEHLKNSPQDAFRYKNEDGSIYVPSWSPPVYEYTDDEGKLQSVKKPKGTSPKSQYVDLPYARTNVTKSEVLALIRDVLGLNQSEALPTILDSKVTPVVVLNDSLKYKSYKYLWTFDLVDGFTNSPGTASYEFRITNDGYFYCFGWVNSSGIGCIDKKGVKVMDEADFINLQIGTYTSNYLVTIDDTNYPNEVNIYYSGSKLSTVNVTANLVNNDRIEGCNISKNGKYLGVAVHDSVALKCYLLAYEGVV